MRAVSLLTVMLLCPAASAQKPEPKYEGKTLAYWIERFQKAENEKDRDAAEQAVIAFGPDAAAYLPTLMPMLTDLSHNYRGRAANMICAMGPAAKNVIPDLVKLLQKPSPQDPSRVIRILCAIGPDAKSAIPDIQRAVENYLAAQKNNEDLSYYLILDRYEYHTLGAGVVPLLISLLNVEDEKVVTQSARELGLLGLAAKDALPALKAVQRKKTETVEVPVFAPAAPAPGGPLNSRDWTIKEAIRKIESPKK